MSDYGSHLSAGDVQLQAEVTVPRISAVVLSVLLAVAVGRYWSTTRPPPTVPPACNAMGKTCGDLRLDDGTELECGACSRWEVCGADGVEAVCCPPTTCLEQGASCGELSDGCGGSLDCGTCPDGLVCGGGGLPNVCGRAACVAQTCASLGAACGRISDGCGAVLECGECEGELLCGGDGRPNLCSRPRSMLSTSLAGGCLGRPERAFTPQNYLTAHTRMAAGMKAIDFTLPDVDGHPFTLSEALADRPVLLELASDTCTVFRANRPGMDALAKRFEKDLLVVTVYTLEAHPAAPDPSPFRGRPFTLQFSDTAQPETAAERQYVAKGLAIAAPRRLVIDALDDRMWCTYGPAPNAAFLIDQSGMIVAAHTWLDLATMQGSIEHLLAERRPGPTPRPQQ